jgi:putative hydrolase of the HAD superfamily
MSRAAARAVTFDYGQTLADLDTELLARRAGERGVALQPARLDREAAAAWRAYGAAKRAGGTGPEPWLAFMRELLERAGAGRATASSLAQWLWSEQPRQNLWRKPIEPMLALCRELARAGVPLAVVSNSEGRLAELVAELGQAELFPVVADSGRVGFEKPDPRLLAWAASRLGVRPDEVVHVGDTWDADVEGALRAGARAIWITAEAGRAAQDVWACRDAPEVRGVLVELGLLGA